MQRYRASLERPTEARASFGCHFAVVILGDVQTWMIAMLTVLTAPIVFAFVYRVLPAAPRRAKQRADRRVSPPRPASAAAAPGLPS